MALVLKLNVYIDESGEAGIAKIREGNSPGASPYFVMAAVVCEPTAEILAKNLVEEVKDRIGRRKWKHATDLKHAQKVFFARELNRLPVRYFAVVSKKSTLGEYSDDIEHNAHKFYNKCAQYLLESICSYIMPHVSSEDDISVYFEEMNHDYDAMIRLLLKVKKNPIRRQSRSLRILNPFCISAIKKGRNEMLEIADFVAHAVYQCANVSETNFGIPEPRYFTELSSRFAGGRQHSPIGTGLKFVHDLADVGLEPAIEEMFKSVVVSPPAARN